MPPGGTHEALLKDLRTVMLRPRISFDDAFSDYSEVMAKHSLDLFMRNRLRASGDLPAVAKSQLEALERRLGHLRKWVFSSRTKPSEELMVLNGLILDHAENLRLGVLAGKKAADALLEP